MSINWRKSWFPIWYGFCPTEKDFRRQMKKTKYLEYPYPDTIGGTVVYKDDYDDPCVMVTINVDWEKDYDLGLSILVHECVHVVEAVIEHIQDRNPSEEFRAYATQAVFTELRKDISDYIKRKGKS